MSLGARTLFALVILCFLLSGMAGLAYQVVWARYLALFLGSSSHAVVAVLVAFMGGLAAGNALFGKTADRSANPLALYGWLEIGIGVFAIFFPAYFEFCRAAFLPLAEAAGPGTSALLALKFLFSFATILLPAALMGATLPVLARFVTRSLAELREKVAALYAINSVGAVAGCLIAEFWWLPEMGLEGALLGGAILNLAAGVLALLLGFGLKSSPAVAPAEAAPAGPAETFTPFDLKLAVAGIGVSGFIAMLYEVAWTRLLGLALGSSSHAFTLMLVTFISGIAAGAWIVYRWKGQARLMDAFGRAELALGAALFVSMFFYENLPYYFSRLAGALPRSAQFYPLYQAVQFAVCVAVMFVPAVLLGITLPLVTRIATAELSRTGRSVGKVFAVNTLGTVLGAVAAGLWLMPALGLAGTFALGVAGNILLGAAVLGRRQWAEKRWLAAPALLGAAAFVALAGGALNERWQKAFVMGLWRVADPPASLAQYRARMSDGKIAYYKDGSSSSVSIQLFGGGPRPAVTLRVNGKPDASTGTDVPTQKLLGHIPLLLRPESRRALIVGLGSGMTASAAARHPNAGQIDVVEISPEVAEAAAHFSAFNDDVLRNPRVRLFIEDAKTFLQLAKEPYDVIISEPSNPWMAGVAGVFTREYYESCAARLAPDGLMAQWVQIYETDDATLDMVIRTFAGAFPHVSLWQTTASDLVLLGAKTPFQPRLSAVERQFNLPPVWEDLEQFGLGRLPVFLTREAASFYNGAHLTDPEGPIHSDYLPLLERLAQRVFFARGFADGWKAGDENRRPRPVTLLGQYLQTRALEEEDFHALARYSQVHLVPDQNVMRSIVSRWQQDFPESSAPIVFTQELPRSGTAPELEAARLAPALPALMERAATNAEPLRIYESYLMKGYRERRSALYLPPQQTLESILHRLLETDPKNRRAYRFHLAELAWDRGDDKACLELGRLAFDIGVAKGGPLAFTADQRDPQLALACMMESLWRAGKPEEAAALASEVESSGFLRASAKPEELLKMTYRKIRAALAPPAR